MQEIPLSTGCFSPALLALLRPLACLCELEPPLGHIAHVDRLFVTQAQNIRVRS